MFNVDWKKVAIGFSIGLVLGTVLAAAVHAAPTKIEGEFGLSAHRVKQLEICVKTKMRWPKPIWKAYTISTSPGYAYNGSQFSRHGSSKIIKGVTTKKRHIAFDGYDQDVFTHELAHVYGANEIQAQEIEWECNK